MVVLGCGLFEVAFCLELLAEGGLASENAVQLEGEVVELGGLLE